MPEECEERRRSPGRSRAPIPKLREETAWGAQRLVRACGEHNEMHEEGGGRNFGKAEHADKGALSDASVIPGHYADKHNDGAEVKACEKKKCESRGAGDVLGRTRFAGSNGEHLDPTESVDGEEYREQGSDWTLGKESPVSGV